MLCLSPVKLSVPVEPCGFTLSSVLPVLYLSGLCCPAFTIPFCFGPIRYSKSRTPLHCRNNTAPASCVLSCCYSPMNETEDSSLRLMSYGDSLICLKTKLDAHLCVCRTTGLKKYCLELLLYPVTRNKKSFTFLTSQV